MSHAVVCVRPCQRSNVPPTNIIGKVYNSRRLRARLAAWQPDIIRASSRHPLMCTGYCCLRRHSVSLCTYSVPYAMINVRLTPSRVDFASDHPPIAIVPNIGARRVGCCSRYQLVSCRSAIRHRRHRYLLPHQRPRGHSSRQSSVPSSTIVNQMQRRARLLRGRSPVKRLQNRPRAPHKNRSLGDLIPEAGINSTSRRKQN